MSRTLRRPLQLLSLVIIASLIVYTRHSVFSAATSFSPASSSYSLWNNTATPAMPNANDSRAIEIGVKFKSDLDGAISGIRFFKGSQNTGAHTVSLWTAAGVLLARNVSSGETASGWQQVNFASPVNIYANTTYIASYHTTSGYYSYSDQYFTVQYDNAPLHALADAASGGNGLWQTSSSPTFPAQNYRAGNFWVDVAFNSTTDITPPVVSSIVVTNVTSTGATVNWTTDEPADGQIEFITPCPASGCLTSPVSSLTTLHAVTLGSLSPNTQYAYRIRSNDSSGNLAITSNQTFTTAAAGSNSTTTTYSLWTNATIPVNVTYADPRPIELGVKFKSDVNGAIYAIRFFKGSQNTGMHTVSLWTAGGSLLARSVSVSETASGWQQVDFASPVNISANTTYVASYHTTSGYYSYNDSYFLNQYDNAPLHALPDATSGGNGLWVNSLTPTFPTQNYRALNFWVDVVFAGVLGSTPSLSGDLTPPVVSSISVTNLTTSGATVNWITDEPADGQVEFTLCPASGCLTTSISALTTSHAINVSGLSANTLYSYRIRSKDSKGNLAITANQTLKTVSALSGGTSGTYSLWTNATTPANVTYADPRAIEVGVRFKSDVDGAISAIRFYKGPQNTGTHTVSLWTTGGTLLARSVSTSETASGWQQANFTSPVNVAANTTYVASYHTTSGYYSYNDSYFLSQYDNAPLHALPDATSGGNGLWVSSLTPTFPTQNYRALNFWVDVVFATNSCGPTRSGTITAVASASDNVGVVGVQFKLDGANYGPEFTAPPYSITWDTRTAANGCHVLTAVARNAAGNLGTASESVNVSNP